MKKIDHIIKSGPAEDFRLKIVSRLLCFNVNELIEILNSAYCYETSERGTPFNFLNDEKKQIFENLIKETDNFKNGQ